MARKKKDIEITAILSIVIGILILIWPEILNLAIGLWLIIFGIMKLIKLR